jgi:hypothetical protein
MFYVKNELFAVLTFFHTFSDLPPFWLHHVTAETTSMSVNIWTDAPVRFSEISVIKCIQEAAVHSTIAHMPLPFEDNWSLSKKVKQLKLFIQKLVLFVIGEYCNLIKAVSTFISR